MSARAACCPRCTGSGTVASAEVCPECAGTPTVSLDGVGLTCEHCYGTGRKNVPCPDCTGPTH